MIFFFFFKERERELFNIYFLVFGGQNIFIFNVVLRIEPSAPRMPGERATAWATFPAPSFFKKKYFF